MTGPEHLQAAEDLLAEVVIDDPYESYESASLKLQRAHVHAVLAQASLALAGHDPLVAVSS